MTALFSKCFKLVVCVCFSWLFCIVTTAKADLVEVEVETQIKPTKVVGLLLSAKGMLEIEPKSVSNPRPGIIVVSLNFDRKKLPSDTVVSAMVQSDDSELAFGNVRPASGIDDASSNYDLPACPAEEVPNNLAKEQYGIFVKIVENRAARRDLERLRTARTLDPSFAKELQKLERGFGLSSEKDAGANELSANLEPAELVDRLARIQSALKSYSVLARKKK